MHLKSGKNSNEYLMFDDRVAFVSMYHTDDFLRVFALCRPCI